MVNGRVGSRVEVGLYRRRRGRNRVRRGRRDVVGVPRRVSNDVDSSIVRRVDQG